MAGSGWAKTKNDVSIGPEVTTLDRSHNRFGATPQQSHGEHATGFAIDEVHLVVPVKFDTKIELAVTEQLDRTMERDHEGVPHEPRNVLGTVDIVHHIVGEESDNCGVEARASPALRLGEVTRADQGVLGFLLRALTSVLGLEVSQDDDSVKNTVVVLL